MEVWTVDNPPREARYWSREERECCVQAANAAKQGGAMRTEAIAAGAHAALQMAWQKGALEGGRMEWKTFPAITIKADEAEGVVEHIVALTGNVDSGRDRIVPGAFAKTLAEAGLGRVKVLDHHQTDSIMRVLGKPLAMREMSRAELPPDLLLRFPDLQGGLWARTQFLMATAEGRGAFERAKNDAVEWSIGYDATDVGYDKALVDGQQVTVRLLKSIRLWEYSPVCFGMNPATVTLSAKDADGGAAVLPDTKGAVPFKATEMCPEGEAWSAPVMVDFSDKAWGDLTEAEKRKIAGHFAYVASMPPEAFGDCKLPHHRASDGKVVWRGVANAMARLPQADIPEADLAGVRSHLEGHYKQFGKDAPAGKARDFATIFANDQAERDLYDARWRMDSALSGAIRECMDDQSLLPDQKLSVIGESLDQYKAGMLEWCTRMMAMMAGQGDGEAMPMTMAAALALETKVGRRFSAASRAAVQAAIETLTALIAEPAKEDDEDEDDDVRHPAGTHVPGAMVPRTGSPNVTLAAPAGAAAGKDSHAPAQAGPAGADQPPTSKSDVAALIEIELAQIALLEV